jgi:hypothetical protein
MQVRILLTSQLFNMILQEEWKDILGFEGLYQISDTGLVRSLEKTVFKKMYGGAVHSYKRKGRIMKPDIHKSGHLCYQLSKENIKYREYAHRLVAMAFIPNPNDLPVVNHMDNNPANNYKSNLVWCTQKTNVRHAGNQGRLAGLKNIPSEKRSMPGIKNPNAKLTAEQVFEIRNSDSNQRALGEKFGVSKTVIRLVKQRKSYIDV